MKQKYGNEFFKIQESLITGIKEIFYNKTRSILTLSGIMLGVASLIAMLSITSGYRESFDQFMNSQGGLGRITIETVDSSTLAGLQVLYPAKGLTVADVSTLKENNSDIIESIVPKVASGRQVLKYGFKSLQLFRDQVVGTTADYADLNMLTLKNGRNIGDFDEAAHSRVCVIGSIVSTELFGAGINPVGKRISINGRSITVVGLFNAYTSTSSLTKEAAVTNNKEDADDPTAGLQLAVQESSKVENLSGRKLWQKYGMTDPFFQKNLAVVMPMSTYRDLFVAASSDSLDSIEIQFKDSKDINGYVARIKQTLREARSGSYEDFSIDSNSDLFASTQSQIQTMTMVFGAIALISLFVGGIGIMNVILASISERIREIGVRKSVGARNIDIFLQFLIETVVLSVIGGLLGILVGSGISFLIAALASMKTMVSPLSILLALLSSGLIGVLFGIYPSLKAAKLSPIEALRYE